jgi:hypothetical protein
MNQGTQKVLFAEKTKGRKSRDTVPFMKMNPQTAPLTKCIQTLICIHEKLLDVLDPTKSLYTLTLKNEYL